MGTNEQNQNNYENKQQKPSGIYFRFHFLILGA
jgi:hypothetical protein